MKFQYSEKKVKLPGNVHAYAEKKVMKLHGILRRMRKHLWSFLWRRTGIRWS